MGFWSWFRGTTTRATSVDRIWLTQEAMRLGLLKELLAQTRPTLVVAHFPATLKRVCADLEAAGETVTILGPTLGAKQLDELAAQHQERRLYAVVARQLQAGEPPAADERTPSLLEIFVAERHFLRTYDDDVQQFAESLKHRCHVTYHLSLQDPLLRQFAGESVVRMLSLVGMSDQDAIESELVTRRIRSTQDAFAKRVEVDRATDNAEDWLLANGFEE